MEFIECLKDRQATENSRYTWINIERKKHRVGKLRTQINNDELIIYSITIYPEYRKCGYGKQVIRIAQEKHARIIADRVRPEAKGFWNRMNFENAGKGFFTWTRNSKRRLS